MPKLLSLNNYHYRRGGSDVVFLEHDALFRERGWDTSVFAMHHPKNQASPWDRYFVDEIEYDHAVSLTSRVKQASKVVWSGEATRKIGELLDRFPADIVHAHCIYHHLSPSVLKEARRRGIPTVMTQHDLKLACPAYKMLNEGGVCEKCKGGNLLNLVANRCIRNSAAASAVVFVESVVHRALDVYRENLNLLIAPSRFYVEKLVEWGWSRKQLRYVPNYVQADRFTPDYRAGDYFLFFGRLAPEKGVATLIRAAASARQRLVIAGTGPIEDSLKALAAEVGGDIEFVGYKSGADLHTLIRQARAVVLPSEWYENAPMSVLEAYALGKPVIGADIGGIPELIDDGVTGTTFATRDVGALAERLIRVAAQSDASLRDMGRAAREKVVNRFNVDAYYEGMCAVYAELGVKLPELVTA